MVYKQAMKSQLLLRKLYQFDYQINVASASATNRVPIEKMWRRFSKFPFSLVKTLTQDNILVYRNHAMFVVMSVGRRPRLRAYIVSSTPNILFSTRLKMI